MSDKHLAPADVRIWDLPLRLFHWLLAVAIAACLYTGLDGGFEEMDWHQRSGYLVLGLVFFRLAWGFLGTRHARFSSFLRGPGPVVAYARDLLARRARHEPGHNPLAGWTIVATLAVITLQAGTGLFATDDLFIEGPLAHLAAGDLSSTLNSIHGFGQWSVGGLVALHLFAILWHRFALGERIIQPMITGRGPGSDTDPAIGPQRMGTAALTAALAAAVVAVLVTAF
ncbi:MAG: cytochrome b/b6 domain-containing protein [Pseudomonadales bacterium]|nr:cytochrome b/b6 domain-containing protein [Pseudomonadales bacterium]